MPSTFKKIGYETQGQSVCKVLRNSAETQICRSITLLSEELYRLLSVFHLLVLSSLYADWLDRNKQQMSNVLTPNGKNGIGDLH